MPISICMIKKAVTDDDTLAELSRRLKYNKRFGVMTIWPCERHKPKCEITGKEQEILNERLKKLDETKS